MSNTASFTRFPMLPTELRLMVWEFAVPTEARGLLVVHRTGGGIANLALVAYGMGNWDFNPQLPVGLAITANAESRAVELASFTTVDIVGDLVRTALPEFNVRQPVVANFKRDMLYMALQPLQNGYENVAYLRPALALGQVSWAPRVQSLAILIGDAPWNFWGNWVTDGDIRQTVRKLQGLQRLWVVLSLAPFWPDGFDNGLRVEYGFMPLDLERQAQIWPWFAGEYEAVHSPFLDRIRRIAGQEGRQDLEVTLVFDVNHDTYWWHDQNPSLYRRYVNTW